jgi:hypothetical protein
MKGKKMLKREKENYTKNRENSLEKGLKYNG